MIICRNSPEISHNEVLKAQKVMVSSSSPIAPTRIVLVEPIRGLTASRSPKLHWQVTLTRRGSPFKIFLIKYSQVFKKFFTACLA